MKLAHAPILALGLSLSSVACSSSSDGASTGATTTAGSTGASTTTTTAGAGGTGGAGGQASGGTGGAAQGGSGGTAQGGAGGGGIGGGSGGSAAGGAGGGGGAPAGCGVGPYVPVQLVLGDVSGKVAMADTWVTSPLCPAYQQMADVSGVVVLPKVQTGTPLWFSMTHADSLPGLTAEIELTAGWSSTVTMLPKSELKHVSGIWTPGTGAMFMRIEALGPNGACSTADGVTVAVPGAPGATIVYTGAQGPDPSLTATSPDGVALAFNLPTSGFVQPTASKAGCKVEIQHTAPEVKYTGRVPVAADALSFAWGFVVP
jgi:hypothetical protein